MKLLILSLGILLACTLASAESRPRRDPICNPAQTEQSASCHFYNVPASELPRMLEFFPQHGMGLQTLSYSLKGDQYLISGSFDASVTDGLPPSTLVTASAVATEIEARALNQCRPRQLSVVVPPQGEPRFTIVWQKLQPGERFSAPLALDDAGFDANWDTLVVKGGYRVADYAEYVVGTERKHAVLFVNDGNASFYFYNRMNRAQLQDSINNLKLQGFRITTLNSCPVDGKSEFAAVWQNLGNGWAAYADMTVAEYEQKSSDLAAQGYRLHKIQAHRDSDRFTAVWKK